jgi:hypothetical protein
MRAEDLRRWVENQRAAEARVREEQRRRGPRPQEAIAGALDLTAVAARLHGWPLPEDDVSRREDERLYDCWHRLRQRLRRG